MLYKRKIHLVIKDCFLTTWMQHADMFEKFKFVGRWLTATQLSSHWHLTPQEMLDQIRRQTQDEKFELVGVIIPDIGSAFVPGHIVYSSGEKWVVLEEICKAFDAPFNSMVADNEAKA